MISPRAVFIIVDREKTPKLIKLLNKNGFEYHNSMLAHGSAKTEIQSYSGLGESEKTLLMCFCTVARKEVLYDLLQNEMGVGENPNSGIAFSMNFKAIGSKQMLEYAICEENENGKI